MGARDHKINYSNEDLIRLIEGMGFKLEKNFYTPFRSKFLNRNLITKVKTMYTKFETILIKYSYIKCRNYAYLF